MAGEIKSALNIEDEMRSSFLDYAMSVIIARALPDVRDGLKPVHRRILYAMHQLRNTHSQPYKKSARVVGDVIGKYHPHGDSAVYDALVRLAQDFAMRYPLVDGQGNFGSIDGDQPAAMRYTEVRMAKLTSELLADLEKDTVDWVPNYDDKELEPSVLPTKIPNLLLNGAVGIAVGMATNIPPHNLGELLRACIALIDDPELKVVELMKLIPGPDFPTSGMIIGRAGIRQAYHSGRGSITLRARATIEEDEKGREAIIVTEIPYQVNKVKLISRIAELVREKKIEGISDIQDYSDRTGMRIWIQIKRDAAAQIVLNNLYKTTELQTTFGVNMIAIVNGRPLLLTLKECLEHFINHRRTVVTRRSRYELRKAAERREIVEGIGVAIDAIERIIALIRAARDADAAKAALMAEPLSGFAGFLERCDRPAEEVAKAKVGPYHLNERQAKAILDMRLQRLTGLEREKVEGEYKELCAVIAYLESILASSEKLMQVIRDELTAILGEYRDERRTEIVDDEGEIEAIDLIADENMIVMVTNNGYVKRLPSAEYRVQARGGVGVKGGQGRDAGDFVTELFEASSHAHVLMFTNTGRVFRKYVYELPVGRRDAPGKAFVNFLDLREGERVLDMVPYRSDDIEDGEHFVVLTTANGYIKRTSLGEFSNIRSNGIIAATIEDDDQLIDARLTTGKQHILLTSGRGYAIRFEESEVRPMGRTARGVVGMRLRQGDSVVSMTILDPESGGTLLTMCEKGYGKRTAASEYRPQGRPGKGIITIKVTGRNGPVAGTLLVDEDDQIMVVTSGGKVIRTPVAGISEMGRATQGVRIIRCSTGERVVALERLVDSEDAEDAEDAAALAGGDEGDEVDEAEELDEGDEGEEADDEGEEADDE
ncbi:MAG: DNA gyrase subunit A [Nannocystaceae bacterium]